MADTTAPVLVSLTLPQSIDYLKSRDFRVDVGVKDEGGAGVDWINIEFSRGVTFIDAKLGIPDFGYLLLGDYTPHTGNTYSYAGQIGAWSQLGTYTVNHVTVMDKAGNSTQYTTPQLAALGLRTSFTLTGTTPDATAPQIRSLSIPALVDESHGPVVMAFGATASDDLSGIHDLVLWLSAPMNTSFALTDPTLANPSNLLILSDFPENAWADGQADMKVLAAAANGVYNIDRAQVTDNNGNTGYYTAPQLAALGANTTIVVSDGAFHPNKVTAGFGIEPRTAAHGGEIVVRLSADQFQAGANTFGATFTYDPRVAKYDGWTAGAAGGSASAQAGVTEVGPTGILRFSASVDNGGQKADFIELRFRPAADQGAFALGMSGATLNGAALPNDFGSRTDFDIPLLQTGTAGGDALAGTAATDLLQGLDGNDQFSGLHAWDSVDGGAGIDTVRYAGRAGDYDVTREGATLGIVAKGGLDGRQTLVNVERLAFADQTLAFDTGAAQVLRLYQAAFDRKPDAGGLGYWINALDHGATLGAVASAFASSDEFHHLYGAKPTSAQLVDSFYRNVLHRAGDEGGVKFWTDAIEHRGLSVQDALVQFSESGENQAQVAELVGKGIAFAPVA